MTCALIYDRIPSQHSHKRTVSEESAPRAALKDEIWARSNESAPPHIAAVTRALARQ